MLPSLSLCALSSRGLSVSRHPLQDTVSEEGCVRLCSEEGYDQCLHSLLQLIITSVHLYPHFPNTLILLLVPKCQARPIPVHFKAVEPIL